MFANCLALYRAALASETSVSHRVRRDLTLEGCPSLSCNPIEPVDFTQDWWYKCTQTNEDSRWLFYVILLLWLKMVLIGTFANSWLPSRGWLTASKSEPWENGARWYVQIKLDGEMDGLKDRPAHFGTAQGWPDGTKRHVSWYEIEAGTRYTMTSNYIRILWHIEQEMISTLIRDTVGHTEIGQCRANYI
jgi:hypothetical protein